MAERLGHQQRACEGGFWSEYSVCVADAECQENVEQRRACGQNGRGSERRVCLGGLWGQCSCQDPDVCSDGAGRFMDCPDVVDEAMSRCVAGAWGPYSVCPLPHPRTLPVQVVDVPNTPVELAIDTRGRQNNFETLCAEATGGDTLVTVRIAAAGRYPFTVTQADFDTVLSLRAVCEEVEAELACYDNTTLLRSGLDVDLEIGEYALLVDGVRGAVGTATVRIERAPPVPRCVAEGNEIHPNATPIEFPTTLEGEVICPVADRADYFGFQPEHPGLVFANMRPFAPHPGGESWGGFYGAGGNGIGVTQQSDGPFDVIAYAPAAAAYFFHVSNGSLAGTMAYDLVFNYSPTLSCEGWQRPGCQSCVDAYEPNNNINEPEAIALNQLMAPVSTCNRDFDFFAVQTTADRDFRVVVNIRMMLGDLDLLVTDDREGPTLTLVQNGLQWTYTGRVARNARSFVRVYMDPGEAFYDLRVTQ